MVARPGLADAWLGTFATNTAILRERAADFETDYDVPFMPLVYQIRADHRPHVVIEPGALLG